MHPDYEDDIKDFDQLSQNIDDDEDDDDTINENLFNRYDEMFAHYNQFGAMFQETAHYIGLLIKKNMQLNREVEQLENGVESMQVKIKEGEEA